MPSLDQWTHVQEMKPIRYLLKQRGDIFWLRSVWFCLSQRFSGVALSSSSSSLRQNRREDEFFSVRGGKRVENSRLSLLQRQSLFTRSQGQTIKTAWRSATRRFQTSRSQWNPSTWRPINLAPTPSFTRSANNSVLVALVEAQPKSEPSVRSTTTLSLSTEECVHDWLVV